MKPTPIIILGVNGNCIDIADAISLLAKEGAPFVVRGFLDDDDAAQGKRIAGYPVLGKIGAAAKIQDAKFVCGIGSPRSYRHKPQIIASANVPAERWATIMHPAAFLSPHAHLGHGSVMLAGSSIGALARVGNHVMVLQNSVISHDVQVGEYTSIATGVCVSGAVTIGTNAYIGSNCSIREGLRVGDHALVGMGSVVTRDVASETVVLGNPARPRK